MITHVRDPAQDALPCRRCITDPTSWRFWWPSQQRTSMKEYASWSAYAIVTRPDPRARA